MLNNLQKQTSRERNVVMLCKYNKIVVDKKSPTCYTRALVYVDENKFFRRHPKRVDNKCEVCYSTNLALRVQQ